MTWHAMNFETPEKAEADRAKFEVPPPGYTGSLRGTVWDDSRMLEGYEGQRGEGIG